MIPATPPIAPALQNDFGSRLVTLSDGQPGLRAGLAAEASEPPDSGDRPIVDFVASSEMLDRHGEVILAAGWRLDRYRRNPVFQNAHQYGDILFTLGKALQTEVRGDRLWQRVEFATDANPMARVAYKLYRGRFLNAVSVGFIPVRWEHGEPHSGFHRKFLEQELLEVSAVPIPSNPEALQRGFRAGAVDRTDLGDLRDLLAGIAGPAPSRGGDRADARVPAHAPSERLLRFARELHALLRS